MRDSRYPTNGFKPHGQDLNSALPSSHWGPFNCSSWPHSGGPSSSAAGTNLRAVFPHSEGLLMNIHTKDYGLIHRAPRDNCSLKVGRREGS